MNESRTWTEYDLEATPSCCCPTAAPEEESPVEARMTFEGLFRGIYRQAQRIIIERQRKYGPHNIGRHGMQGIAVRLGDKLARLDHAVFENSGEVPDESLEDTLFDIMNYAAIAIAWQRGYWTREGCPPLEETLERF